MTERLAAVVVPIYRSADAAERCLRSIVQHTPDQVQLVIVDDASSDAAVDSLLDAPWIHGLTLSGRAVVTRNSANAGFGASCNKAAAIAGEQDVIIVNSDVVVGAGWYQGLVEAASRAPRLATLSTLTNNGTMLSIPTRNMPSPTFQPGVDLSAVLGSWDAQDPQPVQISNAVGHVMYISREAIERVGLFDPVFYPGYGEEVDFCLRASEAGYRHYVAPGVIVFHEGSGSFGKEREELVARHSRMVQARYPYVWKLAGESESNAYVELERTISEASTRLRTTTFSQLPSVTAEGNPDRSDAIPEGFTALELPASDIAKADCVVVHVTPELPTWLPIDEHQRLVVVFERTDLIDAPWLHRTAAAWQNWLARARILCAAADMVLAREGQTLRDWGIGHVERVVPLAPRELPRQTASTGAAAGTLLLGPVSTPNFLNAALRLIQTEPGPGPYVIGEPIPCTWIDPPGERAIRDGLAMSTLPGYRGRAGFPELWTAAGRPCRLLAWGPTSADVAWATGGDFRLDGGSAPTGWLSMSLADPGQVGMEAGDYVHEGGLTIEQAVLRVQTKSRNVARQLLVHTRDRSMISIDGPPASSPATAPTPQPANGVPRVRIRSLMNSLRYEGVAATTRKLRRVRRL